MQGTCISKTLANSNLKRKETVYFLIVSRFVNGPAVDAMFGNTVIPHFCGFSQPQWGRIPEHSKNQYLKLLSTMLNLI